MTVWIISVNTIPEWLAFIPSFAIGLGAVRWGQNRRLS